MEHEANADDGGSRQILIVEDDFSIRAALQELLESEGYRITCAADGEEALELLKCRQHPDLILLDLRMPRVNGIEFRAQQLSIPEAAKIPVIVVTAQSTMSNDGVLDDLLVMRKPINVFKMLSLIRTRIREADSFEHWLKHERDTARSELLGC
jgi:CheY-like chemotaxis protein